MRILLAIIASIMSVSIALLLYMLFFNPGTLFTMPVAYTTTPYGYQMVSYPAVSYSYRTTYPTQYTYTQPQPSVVYVSYTDSGFTPSAISVANGTTVVFTNNSSQMLWVASNPHPSHTDYPELNSMGGISPGGSFSFTFTRSGTWGYHNHMNPGYGGVVLVY